MEFGNLLNIVGAIPIMFFLANVVLYWPLFNRFLHDATILGRWLSWLL